MPALLCQQAHYTIQLKSHLHLLIHFPGVTCKTFPCCSQ